TAAAALPATVRKRLGLTPDPSALGPLAREALPERPRESRRRRLLRRVRRAAPAGRDAGRAVHERRRKRKVPRAPRPSAPPLELEPSGAHDAPQEPEGEHAREREAREREHV